ncbi:MAG: ABC transporter substrate-binding protein [Eubacteriales bacterium]|jgi:branched-chain amino acid transport system substrate-binding protein
MKVRKVLAVLAVVALVATAFVGCGGGGAKKPEPDVIKIGANYELSGAVGQYGLMSLEGIKLAVEEVNAAGGIKGKQVELVIVDNKSDNNESKTVATRLATQDEVLVILGPATSGAVKATTTVSDQYKVPVITSSGTADDVTVVNGKVNKYIFRTCFNDSFQGTVMGNFATKDLGLKNFVILSDNSNDYSMGLAATFKEVLAKEGATVVAEENFTAGDKDFSPILTKIKDKKFDAIYLPAYYEEAGLIIKQARTMGINVPILGADGYDDTKLNAIAGDENLNNVFFSGHYSSDDTTPIVVDFVKMYQEKKGAVPNAFNALGYDMARAVLAACEASDSLTSEDIAKAFAATTNFEGVTGTFTLDANHNPVKSAVVIELKNGVQTFKARVNP